jgi:hypothetical protein
VVYRGSSLFGVLWLGRSCWKAEPIRAPSCSSSKTTGGKPRKSPLRFDAAVTGWSSDPTQIEPGRDRLWSARRLRLLVLTRKAGGEVLDGLTLEQHRDEISDPGAGIVGCVALDGPPDHLWSELAVEASDQPVG